MKWTELDKGAIALGNRPKFKNFPVMRADGCNTVVTLLTDREGRSEYVSAAKHQRMHSISAAYTLRKYTQADLVHIRKALAETMCELRLGSHVFIHCSAGIHRTGSFTYALARQFGHGMEESIEIIRRARPITAEQFLPFLGWAETNLS